MVLVNCHHLYNYLYKNTSDINPMLKFYISIEMISKILVSTVYQKQKDFGAVLLEGRALIYSFLAFLARQLSLSVFFEVPKCLDFSNISWDIVPSL